MKKIKKISLAILLIWILVLFPDKIVLAADECSRLSKNITSIINALSWIWVVPATLTGKLMTNDLVYWWVIHLDVYLWKMWNIMKNMANYTLWFLFLFVILKSFFNQEPNSTLKTFLPKILVAWVLIQASWFVMAALIDVSNIWTAAVASFPTSFMTDKDISWIKIAEKYNVSVDIKNEVKASVQSDWNQRDVSELLKKISPSYNNLSWPLMFLWFGIFRFQDFTYLSENQFSCKSIQTWQMLKLVMLIVFLIPLLLLAIINILRIVYIWFWIIFSPFIVIYNLLWKDFGMEWKTKLEVGSVLGMIFQPMAVVATLSLALILIIWMHNVIWWDIDTAVEGSVPKTWESTEFAEMFWLKIDANDSSTIQTTIWDTTFKWDILVWPDVNWDGQKDGLIKNTAHYVWWALWYIILTFFTVFIMWSLIKVWFSFSQITKNFTDASFSFIQNLWKTVPILPGLPSVWALKIWANTLEAKTSQVFQSRDANKIMEKLNKMFDIWDSVWEIGKNEINQAVKSAWNTDELRANAFFDTSRDLIVGKWKSISLAWDPSFRTSFKDWAVNWWGLELLHKHNIITEDIQSLKVWDNVFNSPQVMWVFDYAMKHDVDFRNKWHITDMRKAAWETTNARNIEDKTYN